MKKLLIVLNLLLAAVTAWKFRLLPEELPLYYSRPWGDEQLGDIWHIVILPILMNSIFFFNQKIALHFFAGDQKMQNIIQNFTLAVVVLFAVVYLRIIFLIT